MPAFELHRLPVRDDAAILAEVRRVADLIPGRYLQISRFDKLSRVHSSTLRKRYGSWRSTLEAAGIGHRFDASNKRLSREEIVSELRRVADKLCTTVVTKRMFMHESQFGDGPVLREFGSWKQALETAGLLQANLGKRYSDEKCFENLLNVWTHYGRPPKHREMALPPSVVGPKAYVKRWGSWLRALDAFVMRVNSNEEAQPGTVAIEPGGSESTKLKAPQGAHGPRDIPLSLRYQVLVLLSQKIAMNSPDSLHPVLYVIRFLPEGGLNGVAEGGW